MLYNLLVYVYAWPCIGRCPTEQIHSKNQSSPQSNNKNRLVAQQINGCGQFLRLAQSHHQCQPPTGYSSVLHRVPNTWQYSKHSWYRYYNTVKTNLTATKLQQFAFQLFYAEETTLHNESSWPDTSSIASHIQFPRRIRQFWHSLQLTTLLSAVGIMGIQLSNINGTNLEHLASTAM